MTFIDLFAGVGGFRKGMELAGHECKGFCEWNKYAAASYISMHLITEEQRAYLATLDKKKRQKEILTNGYLNGEWYSNDIRNVDARGIPKVDCFCFGVPCQDFSIAGKRAGLEGNRSSLIREVFRVIREEREEDRPEWLIYENVKGMLSSNRGGDFLSILMEMDELGYDTEWQIFNSKNWGVPQNRERVYTLGHFRAKGRKKVFPIGSTDGKDNLQVGQIGQIESRRDNPQQYRVYSKEGVSPCLDTMGGGGREPHIPVVVGGVGEMKSNNGTQHYQQDRIYNPDGVSPALSSNLPGGGNMITVKVPGAIPSEHPGQYVEIYDGVIVYAIWYEKYQCYVAIRKLTPRECFRLQGWSDEYFERAEFVNSDSQLYKQAGNGVTVSVVQAIAEALNE